MSETDIHDLDQIPGQCEQPVKLYVCPLVEPTQHCREGSDYSYNSEPTWGEFDTS